MGRGRTVLPVSYCVSIHLHLDPHPPARLPSRRNRSRAVPCFVLLLPLLGAFSLRVVWCGVCVRTSKCESSVHFARSLVCLGAKDDGDAHTHTHAHADFEKPSCSAPVRLPDSAGAAWKSGVLEPRVVHAFSVALGEAKRCRVLFVSAIRGAAKPRDSHKSSRGGTMDVLYMARLVEYGHFEGTSQETPAA